MTGVLLTSGEPEDSLVILLCRSSVWSRTNKNVFMLAVCTYSGIKWICLSSGSLMVRPFR